MAETNDLPEELLLKVHSLLPPRDLKSAVLVDKWWKTVGENPSLWRWCVVTVRNREDIAKFSTRRLCRVQNIRLAPGANWGSDEWELLLRTAEKLPELKNIDGLMNQNLEAVDPGLLARALTGVEIVDLWPTELSNAQITSILQHVLQHTTKLKRLCLKCHYLYAIETDFLARAVNKLEDVSLEDTELSTKQITRILTNMVEDNTNLKSLDLKGIDLSGVEKEVLARGVNRLEQVDLCVNGLSTLQITSILTNMMEDNTNLKSLDLKGFVLSAVEKEVLARGVNRLEKVDLRSNLLNTPHITSILTNIMEQDSKLKQLNLAHYNLSAIEEELLAAAANKLEEVNLSHTELSTSQITRILTHFVRQDSKLKKLDLSGSHFALLEVEEEVLARAVNNLEEKKLDKLSEQLLKKHFVEKKSVEKFF